MIVRDYGEPSSLAEDDVAGGRTAEWLVYAGLLAVCVVLFLIVPLLFDRGIDLTDEGAYLNSIATPGLYPSSLSLYGFFYHPLLTASAYNIVFLRAFNYAALVLLTLFLVVRATHAVGIARRVYGLGRIGLWSAFTASALFFYCIWLPTPNYNSLNVCGALLLAYAVVGMAVSSRFSIRDIVVAAIALSLCALTKPSSGAALALLLLVSAFRAPRAYLWSIFAAGLLSAVLCAIFLIGVRGSPSAAIQAFHESTEIANGLLGSQSTFQVYLGSSLPYQIEFHYVLLVCAVAAAIFLITEFRAQLRLWAIPAWVAAFSALLALCIWMRFQVDSWNRPLHWVPVLFAITIVLCKVARAKTIHAGHLRVALILLLIPFAIGLGSNTGMLRSAAQAAAIWSVASLFVLATVLDRELLRIYATQLAVASVMAVAVVVAWAIYYPQRQVAPLWQQQAWISAHGRERALRTDPATAAYFQELSSSAQANGFSGTTDVVDLSGNAAVTIYVLGGNALGSSYFSSANFWSEWLVERLLRAVPRRRLEQAWIITRAPASDAIKLSVMPQMGLNFPGDYRPVGHAVSPLATGVQTLWKPKILDAVQSPRPD